MSRKIGKKYNMLTVISDSGKRAKNRGIIYTCKCDCGNIIDIRSDNLTEKGQYSCGCTKRNELKMIGETFGKLKVIKELPKEERLYNKKHKTYLTQCECGNYKKALGKDLRLGRGTSCGCDSHEDLTGQVFGDLTVLKKLPKEKWLYERKHVTWLCECSCGNKHITTTSSLKNGNARACGCKNRKYEDLSGKTFGNLEVIKRVRDERVQNNLVTWETKCLCGNTHYTTTSNLKGGRVLSCGCLGESLGELRVREYLEKNKISFKPEYSFKDLYYTNERIPLRFDFAILNDNGDITQLIEYDGIQHFEPVEFFGGEEGYKDTVIRDQIKNEYAEDNNIPLLRIPYTEYENIEQILTNTLKIRENTPC